MSVRTHPETRITHILRRPFAIVSWTDQAHSAEFAKSILRVPSRISRSVVVHLLLRLVVEESIPHQHSDVVFLLEAELLHDVLVEPVLARMKKTCCARRQFPVLEEFPRFRYRFRRDSEHFRLRVYFERIRLYKSRKLKDLLLLLVHFK